MNKNTIKKIILTIVIFSVLILSLVFFYKITSEKHSDSITIIKKIINEKYENVVYFDDSNCLYGYKDNEYDVYDHNGNKLYNFKKTQKLDIATVSKKYFILKDDIYHLYNINQEEIITGNNIYYISDYLIFVDNNIINEKGEILFHNVNNIKSYYKNKYFLVDNYFINEKGKVLLVDYKIIQEKVNDNELDYFIIKKGSKYYCFFPLIDKIIGDGFDKYYEYNGEIYILSNNKIYIIYTNGLRKEVTFTINKNIYKVDYSNAIRKNEVLAIRDYYLGLLETNTNKFYKIMKAKDFSFTYIDDNHINILVNKKNYVYDIENKKIVYTNNFDDIIIFDNGYKTIKNKNNYYLLDDKDRRITSSDKQIILLKSKVIIGKVEKDIVLFDNEFYSGEKISINNKNYYKYDNYIISYDLKEVYTSDSYINYMKNTIVTLNDNKICFYNLKKNKKYYYDIDDYKIVNKEINKNEIILSNDKNIVVLGEKGNVIKKIKNVKLDSISFNKSKEDIIVIIEKDRLFKKYKGAYVFK